RDSRDNPDCSGNPARRDCNGPPGKSGPACRGGRLLPRRGKDSGRSSGSAHLTPRVPDAVRHS
ncbi:MAG TPA: hypothetical protein VGO49_05375, partial [Bradyrhizobium sp.]|nr:hypothetical protein [Bradyrhizobium sp.]